MVMDIIGPLRIASYKDNTHILTIVCMCTSWHEAISLRITTFEIVSKAMIMIFFKVRSSKYNPTRNSSQFISQATKLILENLGVHKVFSSMYHPQTNWAVERFNGPLKVMHAKVTAEHPPNWDALLPSVLFFAPWEVPQTSTKFSPFELLYGVIPRLFLCMAQILLFLCNELLAVKTYPIKHRLWAGDKR